MNKHDKFQFFSGETKDPLNKYTQPHDYTANIGEQKDVGYPNKIASTQTLKTRGTGAAVRGTKSSTKMG
jgi:hypothetical protein